MNHITLKEKKDLVRQAKKIGLRLNGEHAILTNVKEKHPIVSTYSDDGEEYKCNWKIIKDVIENHNGEFVS